MNQRKKALIAVLPGDGIGPEVVDQAIKAAEALNPIDLQLELVIAPVGAAAIEEFGDPLPPSTLDLALKADAVLLGAVGDPRLDYLPPSLRPEAALLKLRRELGLFAALKAVSVPPALNHLSPLREERVSGTDLLIVRELNGDAYTGKPKGERISPDGEFKGQREGFDTMRYAEEEIRRIAHVAFQAAAQRQQRVSSIDKANVLGSSRLWREIVTDVGRHYPDIHLEHLYADNAGMQLISNPTRFDVMLCPNLFGDLLSDAASVLTGSIGLPASALLGSTSRGMFEAGHGSAPDIAGRDQANPLACIRALALLMRHSLSRPDLASQIENAVITVLEAGIRTADLAGDQSPVSTTEMGDAVAAALRSKTPQAFELPLI